MASFSSLDSLIAKFEGYGSANAPTITAGNNPGAVQYGPLAQSFGAYDVGPNGAALFNSVEDGVNALHAVEGNLLAGGNTTPSSFIQAYEGGVPNPDYAGFVASGLGIATDQQIPASALSGAGGGTLTTPPPVNSAGSTSAPPASTDSTNPLSSIWNYLKQSPSGTTGSGPGGLNLPSLAKSLGIPSFPSITTIFAFILGIGLILIGVLFLRPVQQAVQTVTTNTRRALAVVSA